MALRHRTLLFAAAALLAVSAVAGYQKPASAGCNSTVVFQLADPGSYGYCVNQLTQTTCSGGVVVATSYSIDYACGGG
jgi:hypothetical protein